MPSKISINHTLATCPKLKMAVTTFEIYLLLEDNKMSYKFLIVLPYEIHVKVETIFKTGGIPLYCSCCNFVLVQNLNDCTKERYLLCKKIFAHFWNRYNDSLTQVHICWALQSISCEI
uniref:Uncharacterized protein n=1 Tax=Cacopsylla melanoneura TaxID=428564 RepID=A0A8D8T292_9HEMI